MNQLRPAALLGRFAPMLACLCGILLLGVNGCTQPVRGFKAIHGVESKSEPWTFDDAPGTRLTTQHYEIFTTLREPMLVDALPQAMESAYLFYHSLVPAAKEPSERMRFYLFAARGQFVKFTRETFGARAPLLVKVRGGGFSERGVSVIEYVAHQIAFPVVAHEGLHQYLFQCVNENVPAWLNEGLAVLCEGQRWGDKSLVAFDPYFNPLRRNALAEVLLRNEQFSLADLLKSNAGHVVGGSSRQIDAFYGQVWALLLFLRDGEGGKYRPGLERMLESMASADFESHAQSAHVSSKQKEYHFGQAIFEAFISNDFDTVDREYGRFMKDQLIMGKLE